MSVELAAIALDNCACFTTTLFIIIPSRLPANVYKVLMCHIFTYLYGFVSISLYWSSNCKTRHTIYSVGNQSVLKKQKA